MFILALLFFPDGLQAIDPCPEGVCVNNEESWSLGSSHLVTWNPSLFGDENEDLLLNLHQIQWSSDTDCMGAQIHWPILLQISLKNNGSHIMTIPLDFDKGGSRKVFSVRIYTAGVNCVWGPVIGIKFISIGTYICLYNLHIYFILFLMQLYKIIFSFHFLSFLFDIV